MILAEKKTEMKKAGSWCLQDFDTPPFFCTLLLFGRIVLVAELTDVKDMVKT